MLDSTMYILDSRRSYKVENAQMEADYLIS